VQKSFAIKRSTRKRRKRIKKFFYVAKKSDYMKAKERVEGIIMHSEGS
jgi:hypothetical protein